MRISDWSSDVCSSDLTSAVGIGLANTGSTSKGFGWSDSAGSCAACADGTAKASGRQSAASRERFVTEDVLLCGAGAGSPAVGRVGKEGGSTCGSRGAPNQLKTKKTNHRENTTT